MARRALRWWGLVAVAAASLTCAGPSAQAAGIAGSFQITQSHTGVQRSSSLVPPLEKAWSRHVPGDVWYTVSDGRRVFFLSSAHDSLVLYALDGRTGRRLWGPVDVGASAETIGPEQPEPGVGWLTFDGSHVFVASLPGLVTAYAADDGRRLWANASQELDRISTFPSIWDGSVLVQRGGTLLALDAATGAHRWRVRGGAGGDALLRSTMYGSTDCNAAWAYSLPERTVRWEHTEGCSSGPGLTTVVGGGLVFLRNIPASDGRDEALSAADGHIVRAIPSGGSAPVVDGPLTFIRTGTTVSATDTATGTVRWRFSGDHHLVGDMAASNGTVYVGSSTGILFGISEDTGRAVWQSQTGIALQDGDDAAAGPYRGVAPAIAGDLLVVASGQDVVGYRPAESASRPLASEPRPRIRPSRVRGVTDAVSFQATPSHTGRPAGATLARHLRLAWRKQLGGVAGYPLIAGGRVFATAQNATTGTVSLTAFSLRGGHRLWGPVVLPAADNGYINAAYDGGRVMVVGSAGDVAAFRARDGHPLWAIRGRSSIWRTPPVAANGRLFLYFEGSGGILAAINDRTGKPLWAFADFANGGQGVPIVHRRTVYYAYTCDMVALSVVTGRPRWIRNRSCDGSGGPTPALYHHRLYVTDPTFFNRIIAARSGHVLRGYSASTTPALDGNTGFFVNGSVLRAENLGTGAIAWTFRGDEQQLSTPIVAGGRVFVGSASGMLFALSERTGRVVWRDEQPHPVLDSRQVPLRSLVGLNAGDGALAVPATDVLSVYR